MDIIRGFGRLRLTRAPFWAQALAVCALFAIAGVAVVDDYGIGGDTIHQRRIANANAEYIATGDMSGLSQAADITYRYYGIAFDMPILLLAERALGLQESNIYLYLTRHLLTHLFFIAGGFVCGMLAYRMFGNRWIALFAMLLFLLHPRLYAHSFFNSKDIPFVVTLLIALYLTHRAFRKDTAGAFLLCGAVVGLAINLRVFALMLPPLILAMRALDLWQASGAERKRILASAGIFTGAALAILYISHPYYWENPLRFFEGVRVLSQHPVIKSNLFMGEIYPSDAMPWNYIPVWFAITAPPLTLLLGAVGCAAVCWQAVTRPLAALRCRETRFGVLLLGCFALPVAVAIALQSNIYDGWRQMYFLWGPFCLLAAIGIYHIANIRIEESAWNIGALLPARARGGDVPRPHMAQRALAYGIAAIGLTTTLTAMAALHPHQQVYFNSLTDTKTPGALGKRYDMDYWNISERQSIELLRARYPNGALRVHIRSANYLTLSQDDRERILNSRNPNSADYHIRRENRHDTLAIDSVEAYGSPISSVFAPKISEAYHAAYRDVAANGTLLTRSPFHIYIHNGELYYLIADCDRRTIRLDLWVFLRIFPADPADLPARARELGFENRLIRLNWHASFLDGGNCIVRQSLPDYPIARIATGYEGGQSGMAADIDLAAHAAQALYERIAAGAYGQPVAQSDFDVYLDGDSLAYLKEDCDQRDLDGRFLLHIFPADLVDLPADSRDYNFENLNFQFADHGGRAGDICAVKRELPDYPIDRIRTGQFVSGGGWLWHAEFPAAR